MYPQIVLKFINTPKTPFVIDFFEWELVTTWLHPYSKITVSIKNKSLRFITYLLSVTNTLNYEQLLNITTQPLTQFVSQRTSKRNNRLDVSSSVNVIILLIIVLVAKATRDFTPVRRRIFIQVRNLHKVKRFFKI